MQHKHCQLALSTRNLRVDAQLGEASEVHDKGKEKLEKCMIRVVQR
jgi:hypothetical protein